MKPGRLLAVACVTLLLAGAGFFLARGLGPLDFAPVPGSRLSLLAVGDTGQPPSGLPFDAQLRVGRAMTWLHAVRPVDAFLLLGDNFYPDGLGADDVAGRVRGNLVKPYCGFVSLHGPRSAEVADACRSGVEPRDAFPFFAVLGNHDYETPGSPGRERTLLPAYVSNWSTPAGVVEVHELPGGVSLVLAQSEELLGHADTTPLRDALARSRGPWRIVALHRPVVEDVTGQTGSDRSTAAFSARIREAIAASGVEVQLLLAGHEHNLQVFQGHAPGPLLTVVAGGGGEKRRLKFTASSRRFARVQIGFARVDLADAAAGTRLFVSELGLPAFGVPGFERPELLARWSVGLSGEPRDELAAGR